MKKILLSSLCLLSFSLFAQTNSDTLYFTGAQQTWTVPCGAQNISIITYGAQGDSGKSITTGVNVGGLAGLGNSVTLNWNSLVPTDILYINVGGQANGATGGFNGGGNGIANPAANPSGGGGGATDIRFPTNALMDRVQVAGGGGGGGNAGLHAFGTSITDGNGGNGGGNQLLNANSLDGQIGTNAVDFQGTYSFGQPGTTSGGTAAPGCTGFLGQMGSTATSEIGANGGQGNNGFGAAQTTMAPSGGAGGGGYFGGHGGGGGSAGTIDCQGNGFGPGGGGSAGTNFPSAAVALNGVRYGAGLVIINYDIIIDSAQIFTLTAIPCQGQSVTLSVSPAGGLFSSNLASTFAGSLFTPTTSGNFEIYYASTTCGVTTVDTVFALINEIQTAAITAFSAPCVGDSLNLNATPGGGVFTSTTIGAISGTPIDGYQFNPASETIYEIVYAIASCAVQITDTINVVVNCNIASIEEIETVFEMFPNPTCNIVTFSNILGANIQISDLTGKVVFSENQIQNETIDCSSFNIGIYLVNINKNNKITILKLVKE